MGELVQNDQSLEPLEGIIISMCYFSKFSLCRFLVPSYDRDRPPRALALTRTCDGGLEAWHAWGAKLEQLRVTPIPCGKKQSSPSEPAGQVHPLAPYFRPSPRESQNACSTVDGTAIHQVSFLGSGGRASGAAALAVTVGGAAAVLRDKAACDDSDGDRDSDDSDSAHSDSSEEYSSGRGTKESSVESFRRRQCGLKSRHRSRGLAVQALLASKRSSAPVVTFESGIRSNSSNSSTSGGSSGGSSSSSSRSGRNAGYACATCHKLSPNSAFLVTNDSSLETWHAGRGQEAVSMGDLRSLLHHHPVGANSSSSANDSAGRSSSSSNNNSSNGRGSTSTSASSSGSANSSASGSSTRGGNYTDSGSSASFNGFAAADWLVESALHPMVLWCAARGCGDLWRVDTRVPTLNTAASTGEAGSSASYGVRTTPHPSRVFSAAAAFPGDGLGVRDTGQRAVKLSTAKSSGLMSVLALVQPPADRAPYLCAALGARLGGNGQRLCLLDERAMGAGPVAWWWAPGAPQPLQNQKHAAGPAEGGGGYGVWGYGDTFCLSTVDVTVHARELGSDARFTNQSKKSESFFGSARSSHNSSSSSSGSSSRSTSSAGATERDFHLILGCGRDANYLSVHATPKVQQQPSSSYPGDATGNCYGGNGREAASWESIESARFLSGAQANSRLVSNANSAISVPFTVKEEVEGTLQELGSNQWAAALNTMGLEPFTNGSAMPTQPPPPPPVPLGPLASAVPLRSLHSHSSLVPNQRTHSSSSVDSVLTFMLASAGAKGATCWPGEGAQGVIDWDHPLYSPACLAVSPSATAAALSEAAPVSKQKLACGSFTVARAGGSSNGSNNSYRSRSEERAFPTAVATVASGTAPARGGRLLASLPRADASVGLAGAAAALIVHHSEPEMTPSPRGDHNRRRNRTSIHNRGDTDEIDFGSDSSGDSNGSGSDNDQSTEGGRSDRSGDSSTGNGEAEVGADHRSNPTSPLSMVVVQLSAVGDVLATYWPARQDHGDDDDSGAENDASNGSDVDIGPYVKDQSIRSKGSRNRHVRGAEPSPRFLPANAVRQFREPLSIQPFKRLCVPVVTKGSTTAAAASAGGPSSSSSVGQVPSAHANSNIAGSSNSSSEAALLAHQYGDTLVTWLEERPHTLGELRHRVQTLAPRTTAESTHSSSRSSSSSSSSSSSISSNSGVEQLAQLLPQVLACVPDIGRTSAASLSYAPVRFVRADIPIEENEVSTAPDSSDVYWATS